MKTQTTSEKSIIALQKKGFRITHEGSFGTHMSKKDKFGAIVVTVDEETGECNGQSLESFLNYLKTI